jgi:hypothetical protein
LRERRTRRSGGVGLDIVALAIFECGSNFGRFGTGQDEAYPGHVRVSWFVRLQKNLSSTEVGMVVERVRVWTKKNLKGKEGDVKGEKKEKCGGMRLQLAGRHSGGWTLQLRRVILTRPRAEGMWGREKDKGSSERVKKVKKMRRNEMRNQQTAILADRPATAPRNIDAPGGRRCVGNRRLKIRCVGCWI